jgi:Flp pilus assembly protein TadD
MSVADPKNQAASTPSQKDLAVWKNARLQIASGKAAQTLPVYLKLTRNFPNFPALQFECGLAAIAFLDYDLAKRCFRRAAELAPRDLDLLTALGQQYHRLRQPELARASFQAAAEAEPDNVHATLSLASWLERERNLGAAWQRVEETVARHPNEPSAQYYRAFLLQRLHRPAEAETVLRDLVKKDLRDPNLRISSRHLLAVVLDELHQYAEALHWLAESKNEVRRLANVPALEQAYDKADRARRQLLEGLTPAMIRQWRSDTPAATMPQPVALLGGHPRSGTTLLEQILGAHPDVLALDESEAFAAEIWDPLSPTASPASSASVLHELSPSRCSSLRARYYKSLLREFAQAPVGKHLIDKNPGSTAALHLWLRLLPAAKVIITLRDPRDVVLSCYFQQLTLTPVNVNFLSLERAARHYANLTDVWLRLRDLGGFDWIETRYEDIVSDLEKEGRRVTEFLGLSWRADQVRPHEQALGKIVYSPTYADVTQPVHNRAVARWKNYEASLAPLQSQLAPYDKAFGYS